MHYRNLPLMKRFLRDIRQPRKFRSIHHCFSSDAYRMTAERTDTIGNTPQIRISRNTPHTGIKTDRHKSILVFFRQNRNFISFKPPKRLFARQSQWRLRANVQNGRCGKNPSDAPAINVFAPTDWLRKKPHARRCVPILP